MLKEFHHILLRSLWCILESLSMKQNLTRGQSVLNLTPVHINYTANSTINKLSCQGFEGLLNVTEINTTSSYIENRSEDILTRGPSAP